MRGQFMACDNGKRWFSWFFLDRRMLLRADLRELNSTVIS
jgi:hypothetical protein